ncbi:MAG: 50S ribosomal protein L15 [Atribacterota bacterium]|nr:50S ribosomal protein L15 [Atribacterota bacterium]
MDLNNLEKSSGSTHVKKRVGRGNASGSGTTAGRGSKGQKSRSGYKKKLYFEGGQMPLSRRVPKRGFYSPFRKEFAIVNVEELNRFEENTIITPELLIEEGMVKNVMHGIKVLSNGKLEKPLTVKAHSFSQEAIKKIESAGGKAEVI